MTVSSRASRKQAHAAHTPATLCARDRDILWDMEEHFWSSGADAARASTAPDAVMVFPYPPGILQGDNIWSHLRARTGWRSIVLAERRATRFGEIAILTYRVSAEKPKCAVLKALCASTYLHDEDRWLRLSHQQTTVT